MTSKNCEIIDQYVIVRSKDLILKLRSLGAGVEEDEQTKLTSLEAAYFADRKVLPLSKDEILKSLRKSDKLCHEKYYCIKYLRDEGYIVRPSLDGTDYLRLHRKGYRPGEDKTYYLIQVVPESWKATPKELAASLDAAGRLRKELVIAVVNVKEDRPVFLKFERAKFE